MPKSVIITCAITGSIHTPSMSPYLPIAPDEIASEAIAAAEAGAAILHLHARNPQDGRPTGDPEIFRAFLPRIKQATSAVVNITTGGGPGMSFEERLAAAEAMGPEMTSLNMGTINAGAIGKEDPNKLYKYQWEREFATLRGQVIFRNTYDDIEAIMNRIGKEHGARFEFECYDIGHLYNVLKFLDAKLYEPPLFIQFCMGIGGGITAEIDHLLHMIRTAQRLFGMNVEWSVLAARWM